MHLVELSREEHSELKISPDLAEASAARQHLIPIVASEFRKAAIQYPIVFAKPRDGTLRPYVLNGLEQKKPVLVRNETGCRLCSTQHTAAAIFCRNGQHGDRPKDNVLCIDYRKSVLTAAGQKSIVDADGSDSPI